MTGINHRQERVSWIQGDPSGILSVAAVPLDQRRQLGPARYLGILLFVFLLPGAYK